MKLKFTLLFIALSAISCLHAQTGFNTSPVSWSLPQGGEIGSYANFGFNALADGSSGSLVGDQTWTTMDMNGDDKPDIVVTSQLVSIPNYNIDTVFGLPNTPYWKVYLNNGNGYNTNPVNWSLPQGGEISSYANFGFNAIADGSTGNIVGDQSWTTMDMNGDNKPDLVVMSQLISIPNYNVDPVFGMPNTPYWKVYLNTGTGFNTTPVNWSLPQGGTSTSYVNYGYNAIANVYAGGTVGNQTWTTTDMNGDNKPDLVVTSQTISIPNYNVDPVFGMPNTPYWKVYLNTGTGFNTTPVNWSVPQGGNSASYVNYGYNAIANAYAGSTVGNQTWSTMDMNGDNKPDLVVTSQTISIPNYNVDPVFGMPNTPYWKVYLNTGTGFNTTPVNWSVPQGGTSTSYVNYGYNSIANGSAGGTVGNQSWSTLDMNGDNKPDLVITSQTISIPNYNVDPVFGMPNTPYWKVYLNSGTGFNNTALNWTLPQGGTSTSYVNYGYNSIANGSAGGTVGDQTWSVIDMNGDNKQDLAILSQIVSIPNYNIDPVFGMPNTPYWKVYLSNSSLGTTPFDTKDKVVVYPNPSKGIFLIEAEAENINVVICDMTGRTITQQSGKTVDLSGYSKGVYLMNINIENQTITKKIILE